MRALILLTIYCIICVATANAQGNVPDTSWHVTMPETEVSAKLKWDNDTIRYHYNQMKYYVTTILPYLNQATELFSEIDTFINKPEISKKERKAFVKVKEQMLKEKFEDEVKKLNETQGVLLIKLIARQTGINIYHILKDFKNPLTATRWQAWARLHGFNLNKKYNPIEEPWLERIMESLDYPLPEFYNQVAAN